MKPTVKTPGQRKRNFVKVGNIKVLWYRIGDGRTVIDPPYEKRKTRAFTDHEQALREARKIAIELNAGGTDLVTLTAGDRAAYAQAVAAASERGLDVPGVIAEWREARRLIAAETNAPSLLAAVEAGLASLRRTVHTTPEVAKELLAGKGRQDLDARYARDLKKQFEDFCETFPGDIAAISAKEVDKWIHARKKRDGSDLSPKRLNHIRDNIVHLFKFARLRGYLPDKITAAQQVAKSKGAAGDIGIFTPEEISILLANVEEDWIPWLAIAAFSGLRSEEIALSRNAAARKDCLRWEDFDWRENQIFVRASVSKVGKSRRPPLHPNLLEWLAPWRDKKATGPVVPGGDERGSAENYKWRFGAALDRLASKSDTITDRLVHWPNNALRHSYGSYRMAILRDVQKASYEMGNSPEMIAKHYDNPRPPSEAAAWFAITPETVPNVLQFSLPRLDRKREG